MPFGHSSHARFAKRLTATTLIGLSGCAGQPTVGLNANVSSEQPIVVGLSATQPVTISGKLDMDKAISVNIEGLVIEYDGTFIPEPLFGQINENDSTEYVAAVFGEPDFRSTLGDGTVIWRWKYRPKGQAGSLFSVFGGSGKKDEPSPDHVTAIAILKDDKLVKKWRG